MSQSNMDPFDEFEFKPLTDGLGFHKKAYNLKDGLKKTGVVQDELQSIPTSIPATMMEAAPQAPTKKHTFEDVLSALEKAPLNRPHDLKFTETLPRETLKTPTPPVQSPFPKPEAFKTPSLKNANFVDTPAVGTRRGAADSPKRNNLMPATISFESALLDLVIVVGLSLVFMVALLMITKVDLNVVFRNMNGDVMTQASLAVLFLAVMQMYVVISRSFFARTLGEWTFDLQLGENDEHTDKYYPLRIIARSLLTLATGIFILPLLSAILGRDIAGQITGAKLLRQRF